MEFKLILKKLNNTLSEKEDIIFSEWYNDSLLHKDFFEKVKQSYQDENLLVDVKRGWESIEKQIKPVLKKKTNYLKYAIAASVLLLVSLTILLKKNNVNATTSIVAKDIKIGTDKAILTLADGSQILLDSVNAYRDQEITSNGKDVIYNKTRNKAEKLEFNYLTIPRGGQYHVVLSDGTNIWLNSESQLKYPVHFIEGKPREVELVYGEAYLEVDKSTNHSGANFTLKTNNQNITVLGTVFNVKAYKNEDQILSTLVEGSISVSGNNFEKILTPGQQSKLTSIAKGFEVYPVEIEDEISWRNGVFSFSNKPLKDIMMVLSRWYDVDIIINNNEMKNVGFTGVLSKNQPILEILETIKSTNNMTYILKNKELIIE